MRLDQRELFKDGDLEIVSYMEEDGDSSPLDEDWPTNGNIDAWKRDDWCYVYMRVVISWRGYPIGEHGMGGIAHGYLGEQDMDGNDVNADAWENIPAKHVGGAVIMGSPLSNVVEDALINAAEWLESVCGENAANALVKADAWANKNVE